MTNTTGMRLLVAALAAGTALSGAYAQTAPGGRPAPIRLGTPSPSPSPTATPTPAPAPTPAPTPAARPAPIRLGPPTPAPAATPKPAPAPAPAPTPAPAPSASRPAPIRLGTPPATPTPAPAPIRLGVPKPAATPAPAPAPAQAPAAAPSAKPGPVASAPPKPSGTATAAGQALNTLSIASRPSDPVRGNADEILPSARIGAPRVPAKIQLRTGDYAPQRTIIAPGRFADQLKSLGQTKPVTLAQLKANPRITMGTTVVDMTPVLANPNSVANRAIALQALSDSARINNTSFTVTQVPSGLIVRGFVNYALLPGSCTIAARRAKVEATGLRCASPTTAAVRDKAFSTPGDPHYVADPVQRAAALALAKERAATETAQLAQDVATLRADLKDPARRAELVAVLGAAEVSRIEALDDTGLAAEIINSGDTKIEDVSYIPLNDVAQTAKPAVKLGLTPPPAPGGIESQFDLGVNYFLTGFTLGREHEWRMRIEQRINRCIVGCAKTYFVEAYAGFNYGLGLRFPIEVTGKAVYSKAASGTVTASVTPSFRAFNGGAAEYLAAGLPKEKLFEAQEFVAQLGAHAGFAFDLPFIPPTAVNYSQELNFADYLPVEMKDGQFAPPNPNSPPFTADLKIFDVDLIGAQANFGVVGAQVYPLARLVLSSDKLTFDVLDRNSGKIVQNISSGQNVPLVTDTKTGALEFDIKDPIYNFTVTVEPGINARLFVDIGVWSKKWDFPIYFPSLGITLPAGGVDFACHDGTICSRDYTLTPDSKQISLIELARWSNKFETFWFSQCPDKGCEEAIRFIRLGYEGVMRKRIQDLGPNAPVDLKLDPFFAKNLAEADALAKRQRREADLRRFSAEFEPRWVGKCADSKCTGAIKLIRVGTELQLKKLLPPGVPVPPPVSGILLEDAEWQSAIYKGDEQARAAILESLNAKIAGAKDKWIGAVKSEYDPQCLDAQCLYEVALIADEMGGKATALFQLSPELKAEGVKKEMITRYRSRFKQAVANSVSRKNGPDIR